MHRLAGLWGLLFAQRRSEKLKIWLSIIAFLSCPLLASADGAHGEVVSFSGNNGELIMSRDGVVYWLRPGSKLLTGDIVRSKKATVAVIAFDGCEFELPAGEDVFLDEEFCDPAIVAAEPTAAEKASAGIASTSLNGPTLRASSPLVVGGVVLSAGGLAAASGGDGGGAGSETASASGSSSSNPNSS